MSSSSSKSDLPVALVTGAASGIGYGIAESLAGKNFQVLVTDINFEAAEMAVAKITGAGGVAEPCKLDVTSQEDIEAAVKQAGKVDVLVNNAGIMIENPAQAPSEQSLDTWKRTFDTNVYALVAVTQAFLPLIKQAKSGRIVNVSSMLGSQTLHADPASGIYDFKIPAYNASKAAVNSWTLSLAYGLRNTRSRSIPCIRVT